MMDFTFLFLFVYLGIWNIVFFLCIWSSRNKSYVKICLRFYNCLCLKFSCVCLVLMRHVPGDLGTLSFYNPLAVSIDGYIFTSFHV